MPYPQSPAPVLAHPKAKPQHLNFYLLPAIYWLPEYLSSTQFPFSLLNKEYICRLIMASLTSTCQINSIWNLLNLTIL